MMEDFNAVVVEEDKEDGYISAIMVWDIDEKTDVYRCTWFTEDRRR